MQRAELKEALKATGGGTPQAMSAAVGVPRDGSFKRALGELVEEGVFEARGHTSDRAYVPAGTPPDPVREPEVNSIDAALLGCLPCTAHELSAVGHEHGLEGTALGQRKLALGIETYKGEKGRWLCRATGGVLVDIRGASGFGAAVDLGIHDGPARPEAFGPMAAKANAKASGGNIGGKSKTS
jgi:hypothetical protein